MNSHSLLWGLLIIAVAGVMALRWYGKKPCRHKGIAQEDIPRFFQRLLTDGLKGGFLVIEVPQTRNFMQFSKYVLRDGQAGLQLDFPSAPWSERFYGVLKEELSKAGFKYDLEQGSDNMEFVTVDLGADTSKAVELAKLVLQKVFKLDSDGRVTLYFGNVRPSTVGRARSIA